MGYVLGIDLGTSYFKAGIFDDAARLCGLGRQAVVKDDGAPRFYELTAGRFRDVLKKTVEEAAAEASISVSDIEAVGYSSQSNSFLLLDKNGNPLTPLVLWPDTRCGKVCGQMKELWDEPDFMATTGIGIDASEMFMVNKLLWYQNERPDIWAKTASVKTISDYLIFALTGNHLADLGTASLLGILEARGCRWWPKALHILGIDESLLGETIRGGSFAGETTRGNLAGLKPGIPVYAGSLDHHIAAIGAGLGTVARMSESTGTVVACVNIADEFVPSPDVCLSNGLEPGRFFQLTFDGNGAVSLEWYRNLFAPNYSFAELDDLAKKAGSCKGLRAKPHAYKYKGLDAFEGVRPDHTHGHFFRALLESISLTLNELIRKLAHTNKPETVVSTGGGARSDFWLELKSEISGGCTFFPADCAEPACKGAAMLIPPL
jgi:sugar (pentulose or hexulose) kinase